MEIKTEWTKGKYPSFNIKVASTPGKEPFMTIRSCQIKDGPTGKFISYPAKKQEDGKYFKFFFGNDLFNRAVLEKALQSQPAEGSGFDDMKDDVPFN
jgi:DNA-binding cell septation regulator SpoVG